MDPNGEQEMKDVQVSKFTIEQILHSGEASGTKDNVDSKDRSSSELSLSRLYLQNGTPSVSQCGDRIEMEYLQSNSPHHQHDVITVEEIEDAEKIPDLSHSSELSVDQKISTKSSMSQQKAGMYGDYPL